MVQEKPLYRGGLPEKEGLDSLQIYGEGGGEAWQERGGGVFQGGGRGVDTPVRTMLNPATNTRLIASSVRFPCQ